MDNTFKSATVGLILTLVALFGFSTLQKPPNVTVTVPEQSQQLAALPGPDIGTRYLRWGQGKGLPVYNYSLPFVDATSTPCRIVNDQGTSSVEFIGVRFNGNYPVAITWDLSTATAANTFASSSNALIRGKALAANAQDSTSWFPTSGNSILGPGEAINIRIATATTPVTGLSGSCYAVTMVHN